MALPSTRQPPVSVDRALLAPQFDLALAAALTECVGAGWDAVLHEAWRSAALQQWYADHGASNARTGEHSWHCYGLAADIVSAQHGWDLWGRSQPTAWQQNVVRILKSHGLAWGGDWHSTIGNSGQKDWPHFQWGHCLPSPGPQAQGLYLQGLYTQVWPLVGAV